MFCPTCATVETLPVIHTSERKNRAISEEIVVPRAVLWAFGIAFGTAVLFGLVAIMRK